MRLVLAPVVLLAFTGLILSSGAAALEAADEVAPNLIAGAGITNDDPRSLAGVPPSLDSGSQNDSASLPTFGPTFELPKRESVDETSEPTDGPQAAPEPSAIPAGPPEPSACQGPGLDHVEGLLPVSGPPLPSEPLIFPTPGDCSVPSPRGAGKIPNGGLLAGPEPRATARASNAGGETRLDIPQDSRPAAAGQRASFIEPTRPGVPGPDAPEPTEPSDGRPAVARDSVAETTPASIELAPFLFPGLLAILGALLWRFAEPLKSAFEHAGHAMPRLGALFSRIEPGAVLAHPRRRALVDLVGSNPGERWETVRRRLGLHKGTFEHHVRILLRNRLLVVRTEANTTRLFPPGLVEGPPAPPTLRKRILQAVQERAGSSQQDIVRILRVSKRVVSYHIRALQASGLVQVRRIGVKNACFVTEASPTV